MSLEILSVTGKGDLKEERIVLKAIANTNLSQYVLIDKTFDEEGHIANLGRHAYKFPNKTVAKDDLIILYTTSKPIGFVDEKAAANNVTWHFFYWGRKNTVWNQGGDTATLLRIIHSKAV